MTALIVLALSFWSLPHKAPNQPKLPAVELAWDPSSDPAVVSYTLYVGSSVTNWSLPTVGNSVWASNLVYGVTYSFEVTATDLGGLESAPSNEVFYTVPLPKTNVVLVVTGATQWAPELNNGWQPNFEDPFVRTNEPGPLFFISPFGRPSITVTNF
ncbi:MAG: hypothetical protein KGL39_45455 [Patescibacteria group bacterium]|nr:hypothetical protein [Patescibacteria group bacterium]